MRVLEDMEKGGNEWKKPWVEASPLPPHNPVSGTQYSGRNFLYTYVYGMMRGYADPRWATEKQIKEMGWKVPENLQNGRGGINDELGVGIEHWGMYAYIPRVKKDGTPLTDKGGTQKFTRVRAVKENGVWGRYRKGDNGKYEFEQLPSGVHPHPEYREVVNNAQRLIDGTECIPQGKTLEFILRKRYVETIKADRKSDLSLSKMRGLLKGNRAVVRGDCETTNEKTYDER